MATLVRMADESPEEFSKRKAEYDRELVGAYRALFGAGEAARLVLEDLDEFCRADRTCLVAGSAGIDIHATLVAEGRREVRLRIQEALKAPKH